MSETSRAVEVTRVRGGVRDIRRDHAATEEPMEVRIHGEAFAVIMRTPGRDHDLAAGFLLSEQIVRGPDEISLIRHCTDPETPDLKNVVDVTLQGEPPAERIRERRQVMTSSSCGLCGRLTLDSLRAEVPPIDTAWQVAGESIVEWPRRLRVAQAAFDRTGGMHAAGLFDAAGELLEVAEDVGRHNAVDKVVGRMLLRERLPLSSCGLAVSGRASFEIVQKALLAGIPVVAAVSAPTTLAIELAEESGITLLGFVRDGGYNIYSHPERIA
jgi:FdhD protein